MSKRERIIEKFAINGSQIKELNVPVNESKIKISEGKTADVIMRVKHPIGIVDEFTANKTFYEKGEVEKGIKDAKEVLENGGLGGYANHPDDDREADLLRTTHYTRDMTVENGTQYAVSDIINTNAGRDLAVQLRTGRVGVSTRNFGVKESYKEGTAIKELEMGGFDYVEVPSAGIYTNPNELSTESLDKNKKEETDFQSIVESNKITTIEENNNGFDKSEQNKKIKIKTGEANMDKIALKKLKIDIKGLVKEAVSLKPLQAIKELNSIHESIEGEGLEDLKNNIKESIANIESKIEKVLESADKDEMGKPDNKTDADKSKDGTGGKPDKDEDKKKMDLGVQQGEGKKGENVDTKEKGVEAKDKKKEADDSDKKDEDKDSDKKDEKSDDKKDEKDSDKKDEEKEADDSDKKDEKSDDKKDEDKDSDKKDDEKKDEKKESKLDKIDKTLESVKDLEEHIVESNRVIQDMAVELLEKVNYAKSLEKAGLKTKTYSEVLEAELLKAKTYVEKLETKVVEQDNALKGIGRTKEQDISVVEHLEKLLVQHPQLESFKEELSFIPTKDGISRAVEKQLALTGKAGIHASQFSPSRTTEHRLDLPNGLLNSSISKESENKSKSYERKVLENKLGKDFV